MKKNTWKRHAALALVGAMAVGSLNMDAGSKSASSDNTQTTREKPPEELLLMEKRNWSLHFRPTVSLRTMITTT